MAMRVQALSVGVDVSKAELVVYRPDGQALEVVANEACAIRAYLRGLPASAQFAVEATNTYHLVFLEEAHRRGHRIYVVSGYRLSRYRDSVGGRAKTDACDARLLSRYLAHERNELRAWTPPPAAYTRLHRLLGRRAVVVRARVSLEQSLGAVGELRGPLEELRQALKRTERQLRALILAGLREAGWGQGARCCQSLDGVGELTAAGLTVAFHRGPFAHGDAYIAFLGLDPRARDSGKKRGPRKLSKQGDPELRRLLYLAAMRAARHPQWAAYYQRYRDRGLSTTEAYVALARKLARVAFALLRDESTFQTDLKQETACLAT